MPTRKKKIHGTDLDGNNVTHQLDIWSGQKKKSVADFSDYFRDRNKVLADLYPYLLTEYEDFLNLDYRKKK